MVDANELLSEGVVRFNHQLRMLSRSQILRLCDDVTDLARPQMDDDDVVQVCLDFAILLSELDADIAVDFSRSLLPKEDTSNVLSEPTPG